MYVCACVCVGFICMNIYEGTHGMTCMWRQKTAAAIQPCLLPCLSQNLLGVCSIPGYLACELLRGFSCLFTPHLLLQAKHVPVKLSPQSPIFPFLLCFLFETGSYVALINEPRLSRDCCVQRADLGLTEGCLPVSQVFGRKVYAIMFESNSSLKRNVSLLVFSSRRSFWVHGSVVCLFMPLPTSSLW